MPERIVVIGCAGSGKSTLACTLSGRLCLRYVARDDLLGPGQESPEHRDAVERATADQQWVFDGTPFAVEDLVYVRAGAIVFLDYSRAVVVWRSIRRAVRILITRRPDGPHQPAGLRTVRKPPDRR
jgi:adenylate kinase family enzyme